MNPCENCTLYVHGIGACMCHGYRLGEHLPGNGDPCPEFEPVPEIKLDSE